MKQFVSKIMPIYLLLALVSMQMFGVQDGCTVDVVIVGDGTAGATLANLLTNNNPATGKPYFSVVVLETGYNRSTDPNVTAGVLGPQAFPLATNPLYATCTFVPDPNTGLAIFGYGLQYSSGKMWGGSSGHNFLFSVRGDPIFWNNMAAPINIVAGVNTGGSGNPLFAYTNAGVLGFAKALETYTPNGTVADPTQRGASGPLFITQVPGYSPTDPWQVAFVAHAGVPTVPDFNAGVTLCVSVSQSWITPTDPPLRSYAVPAFESATVVTPEGVGVNGRPLLIASGAHATKILFSGTTAVGVQYMQNNQLLTVFARKKVILSAGCPFSAQLLQLSGVGDPAVLTPLGIPVVIANPSVGAGLKVHYGPLALTNQILSPIEPVSWIDGTPYYTAATGTRKFELYAFPEVLLLNNETLFGLGISNPFGTGSTFIGWNVQPKSVGSAFIVDNNPFSLPNIQYNLYTDGDLSDPTSDISASVAALKLVRDICGGNANMIYPTPADYAAGDATLANVANATLVDSFLSVTNHYVGTCGFGTVVDSNFNVIGATNLSVVDNSVYHFPETGNTSESAYMAAVVYAVTNGIPFP